MDTPAYLNDITQKLKDYGWDKIQSGAHNVQMGNWEGKFSDVPGVGQVFIDPNGRMQYTDPTSAAKWKNDGQSAVYDFTWDGNGDPTAYQASHSGISPEKLAMLTAAAITAGTASGFLNGGEALAQGAGEAINPAMHFSDAAFDAGLPNAATGATEAAATAAPHFSDAAFDAAKAGTDSALSMPEYANESAKLLQQQALADNGVNLLPTDLPSIDTNALPWKDVAKQVAKTLLGGGAGGVGGVGGFNGQLPATHSSGASMGGVAGAGQPGTSDGSIGTAAASQMSLPNLPQFSFNDYQQISPGVAKHEITPTADQMQMARIAKALKG